MDAPVLLVIYCMDVLVINCMDVPALLRTVGHTVTCRTVRQTGLKINSFYAEVQLTEVVYLTLHDKNYLISGKADKTEARMYQNVGLVLS
jgi:hypothetical protein